MNERGNMSAAECFTDLADENPALQVKEEEVQQASRLGRLIGRGPDMLQADGALRTTAADHAYVRNRLLETMPPEDFSALRDRLELVDLKKGTVIQDANRTLEHTYSIESGVVSIVTRTNLDGAVEILTCGNDGLIGIATVLDGGPSVHRACVQVAGSALRVSTADFTLAMSSRPSIREHLMSYLRTLI